jgi:hypothetical protein
MPFGLKDAGETFQRAMDHAFKDPIEKFITDYQDDLMVHSKLRERHLKHLRQVFEICIMFGIFLNPKKCLFSISKGKLLGHIVSKEGIYIYLERVNAINHLNPPVKINVAARAIVRKDGKDPNCDPGPPVHSWGYWFGTKQLEPWKRPWSGP